MDWQSRRNRLALAVLSLGFVLTPGQARAQFGFGGPAAPPSGGAALNASAGLTPQNNSMGMFGGGNMSPMSMIMMNQMMNPSATSNTATITPGMAALFMISQQQSNGGIGSGMLGGPNAVLPGGVRRGSSFDQQAALDRVLKKKGANVPGGNASQYFDRSFPTKLGPVGYYNRKIRQFPSTSNASK